MPSMPEALTNVTIIAGLIAAVVSVFGYYFNARAQRASDDRRFDADRKIEQLKIDNRAKVLRAIVRSEFLSVSRILTNELKVIKEKPERQGTWIPAIFSFKIIKESPMELGLLSPKEAEAVMDAYYAYQRHRWYILANGIDDQDGAAVDYNLPIRYPLHDPEKRKFLCFDLQEIVRFADSAVASLNEASNKKG